jgi:hypothetical protein
LFLFTSFLIFVCVPRHVPKWKRIALFGLPGLVVICCLSTVCFFSFCAQWKELSPRERLSVDYIKNLQTHKGEKYILAELLSARSGGHMACINVRTGAIYDLGRDIFVAHQVGETGRVWFKSQLDKSLPPTPADKEFIVIVDPDGAKRTVIMQAWEDTPEVQSHCTPVAWTPDGELFVYKKARTVKRTASAMERTTRTLGIADRHGKVRREMSGPYTHFVAFSDARQVLAVRYHPGETWCSPDKAPPTYVLLDPTSNAVEELQLPGRVVSASRDLRKAACLTSNTRAGRVYHSFVMADLATREERVLISEEEMPSEVAPKEDEPCLPPGVPMAPPRLLVREPQPIYDSLADRFYFNAAFDKAIRIKSEIDGDFHVYSLVLVDLGTGEKRVVVPSDALPKKPATWTPGFLQVNGFTPDGEAFVYLMGDTVFRLDTATWEQRVLAELAPLPDEARIGWGVRSALYVSPGADKVLEHRRDLVRSEHKETHTFDVFERGTRRTIHCFSCRTRRDDSPSCSNDPFWLDEEQVVMAEPHKILLVRADGKGVRQIFPRSP